VARTYRTEAIVLKKHKYGEADNVLSLLSPRGGRVGAIAKGVRKTKSKFGGRLEPFSHVDVMLHRGRGSLQTLTQAESIESFDAVRTDYEKLSHGAAALDLLDRVAMEEHSDERLFGLALATLHAIAAATGNYARILSAFEVKLMAIIGYRPHLDACVICGGSVSEGYFSDRAGGILCTACAATDGNCAPVGDPTLQRLRHLLGARMAEVETLGFDEASDDEVARVLRGFVACHVQSRLKGREFLERSAGNAQS